jgi:hypothetical protein
LSYLKALLWKLFQSFYYFLKNLFEKNLESKHYFLTFVQLYASLLAKDCFTKLLYSIQVWFFKTMIEWASQLLFYKLLFYYFNRIDFKPNFYYFMQASPPCNAHKVLFENIFYFGNLVYYCFKTL